MLRVLRSQESNTDGSPQLFADTLFLVAAVGDKLRIQWNRRVYHGVSDGNEDDSPRTDLQSQNRLDVFHKRLGKNDKKRKRTRMRLYGNAE